MKKKIIIEDWRWYKKHCGLWRIRLGQPAISHTVIHDNGEVWELWFNLGDMGVWWRR